MAALLALLVTSFPATGVLADSPAGILPAPIDAPNSGPAAIQIVDAPRTGAPPVLANQSLLATVEASAHPRILWRQLRKGLTVKGRASWYRNTRGYAGVAHVAMPGAPYVKRGRKAPKARICVGQRCVTVLIVDTCGCYVRTRNARVADLSIATVHRLGLDPRRGIYRIRLTLLGR